MQQIPISNTYRQHISNSLVKKNSKFEIFNAVYIMHLCILLTDTAVNAYISYIVRINKEMSENR